MIRPPAHHHDPVDLSCCHAARVERLEQAARATRDEALTRVRDAYTERWRPWRKDDEPTIPYARDVLSIVLGLGVVLAVAAALSGCSTPEVAPEETPEVEHTVWAQGLLSPEGGWLSAEIDALRVHVSCPPGATATRRILEIEITGTEVTTRPGRTPIAGCEMQVFAPWPATLEGAQIRRLTETVFVVEDFRMGATYEIRRVR